MEAEGGMVKVMEMEMMRNMTMRMRCRK